MVERRTIVSMIAALVLAGAMVGTGVPKSARPPDESVNSSELAGTAPKSRQELPAGLPTQTKKSCSRRGIHEETPAPDGHGQEWQGFQARVHELMEAEFDRLDTKHDGELDVKELAKLRLRPYVGK